MDLQLQPYGTPFDLPLAVDPGALVSPELGHTSPSSTARACPGHRPVRSLLLIPLSLCLLSTGSGLGCRVLPATGIRRRWQRRLPLADEPGKWRLISRACPVCRLRMVLVVALHMRGASGGLAIKSCGCCVRSGSQVDSCGLLHLSWV